MSQISLYDSLFESITMQTANPNRVETTDSNSNVDQSVSSASAIVPFVNPDGSSPLLSLT